MSRGLVARAYPGPSSCRFCGDRVASLELSDGTVVWPEGLRHHVEQEKVRLPDRFVQHAPDVVQVVENRPPDLSWWGDGGVTRVVR